MARDVTIKEIEAIVMDEARDAVFRAATYTAGGVRKLTPRRTGHAQRSITASRPKASGKTISCSVGSNVPYVRYLNDGTGLYGPFHRKITPKTKQALAFVASSAMGAGQPYTLAGRLRNSVGRAGDSQAALAGLVVVRSVRGIHPMGMFERGVAATREDRIRALQEAGPKINKRLEELQAQ
jgi:hypothetical protein